MLALAAGILSACDDAASPATGPVSVPVRAFYAGPAAAFDGAALDRIRVTVRSEHDGLLLGPFEFAARDALEWLLPLEVPPASSSEVVILVELSAAGVVEYSGRSAPIRLAPGAALPATLSIPIFPGPAANLDISSIAIAGAAPLVEGATLQLSAQVSGASGGARVSWRALDPTLATVDRNGLVTARLPGTARIMAIGGQHTATAELTIGRRMARIELTPAAQTLTSLGQEARFNARVMDPRDAEFRGITVEWSSSEPGVAAPLGEGRFRALRAGSTTITARVAGSATPVATGALRVTQEVAAVSIAPATVLLDALGATATLSAKVVDAGGSEVAGAALSWTSSDPAVASVNASGLVTALAPGTARIRASSGAQSATSEVSVIQRITGVTVTPSSASFTAINQQSRFTARAVDVRGNPVAGARIDWRVLNTNVAIVDTTGLVTATGGGTTTVYAGNGGTEAGVAITVTQVPGRIVLAPLADTVMVLGKVQLSASVRDANGFPIPGTSASFVTRNPDIATTTSAGLVTGVAIGSAVVAASAGTITNTALITVTRQQVATVTVTPATATIEAIAGTTALTAKATDSNGNEVPAATFTWTSSNTAVATVNAAGTATAVSNGSATITATSEGVSGTAALTVAQRAVAIIVTVPAINSTGPNSATIETGESIQLTVSVRDANGFPIPGAIVLFSSRAPGIAQITSAGLLSGNTVGNTVLDVSAGSVASQLSIAVMPATIQRIHRVRISPSLANFTKLNETHQFSARAFDQNGQEVMGATFNWRVSDPTAATVTAPGSVKMIRLAPAQLIVSSGTAEASAQLDVVPAPAPGAVRVAAIGCNCGNNAANQIFSSGDLDGVITRMSNAQFNAIPTEELRTRYDVLVFTGAHGQSETTLNANWWNRLQPFVEAGGGVYWEQNYYQVALTQGFGYSGGVRIRRINGLAEPGLTDGVTDAFVHNHSSYPGYDGNYLRPFLEADEAYVPHGLSHEPTSATRPVGLYGYAGAGRIVISGPDNDYHGVRGDPGAAGNQYRLLLNIIRWVSHRVPPGSTGL